MEQHSILASLKSVKDLASLSYHDKEVLASEIRRLILETVSKTGGHLAPNLGVVELTIALLSVFDVPKDTIVFDVGHQCYAWKILTGRLDAFPTLRQKDGLSGFPKREESPYDAFNTGHSSTSISACAGIARAKALRHDPSRTVALIGDGAIENGLALEALSDIGEHQDNMLIILNDNHMCIDQAAGSIANHLERLRTSTRYLRMKPIWEKRLQHIPFIGPSLVNHLAQVKRRWRTYKREGSILIEELGFRYYGPVDGHDIRELERHLRALFLVRGPVLLHVVTTKGKGYAPAEEHPEYYHGVSAFDLETGVPMENGNSAPTFWKVFSDAITEMAADRKDIAVIVAAMTQGTKLSTFAEKYPDRFWDVGIAEEHAVTMAAGMASEGIRPVVALYSTFLQRAFDEMLHDVCLQNLTVLFAIGHAGLVGEDGDTHQGLYDLAYAVTLPNLTVFAPAVASDLKRTLEWAMQHDGPVLIRYPKSEVILEDLSDLGCQENAATSDDHSDLRCPEEGTTTDVFSGYSPSDCGMSKNMQPVQEKMVPQADLRSMASFSNKVVKASAGDDEISEIDRQVAQNTVSSACLANFSDKVAKETTADDGHAESDLKAAQNAISSISSDHHSNKVEKKATEQKEREEQEESSLFALRRVMTGKDLTVVAIGPCVADAFKACQRIMAERTDLSVELFSCLSVRPFDYRTVINSIHKTNKLLMIEESVERGGAGSMVVSELARRAPGCMFDYVGVTNLTRGAASREELIALEGLDATGLEERMLKLIDRASAARTV